MLKANVRQLAYWPFLLVILCLAVNAYSTESPFDRYPIHFVTVDETAIAYQDMGARDGEPVLLIMGLGAQMLHWGDTLVQGLLDQGYRVVLIDNRDAGLSQKFYRLAAPPVWWTMVRAKVGLTPEPAYGLQDMAADAVGVLQALGIDRAHIVGASMGGMIAQVLAAAYPLRALTLTSIMSSSGAPNLSESSPEAVSALASGAKSGLSREEELANRVSIARTIGSPEYFSTEYARQLAERVMNRGSYGPGTVRQFQAILASGDRTDILKTIAVPTLVIHGDKDPLLPLDHGRDTAEKIPGAEFVAISGMGHALEPEVSRRVLSAMLPFWRAQLGSQPLREGLGPSPEIAPY
ncbi:alpha/beta fold hydrolase [Microbulbifer sp. HZ11]|uniref:alpha/beta fold hydrolase n=1 Tax=Microbulbifer sp. HZ11 TaxID=1453501 RepID=UPI00068C3B10|nr:alpha/beta hydrolase [Microbulbifer sp. HZ11]